MASPIPPTTFEAFQHLQITKYLYVSATTVLLWDIALTFDLEVSRVWKTRGSLGKYLFLFNRYLPPFLLAFDLFFHLLPAPSVSFCRHSFLPAVLLGLIVLGTVEFVLVLRTYALYQHRWLLWFLTTMCILSLGTMMVTPIVLFQKYILWVPPANYPLPGCAPECASPTCKLMLTVFWIPFFVLETTIVVLTVWKSWTSYSARQGVKRFPLVTILYRDGIVYYFVIMSISVTNLVVWVAAPISLSYLAISMMRSLQVTISSRILLNIRGMLDPGYGVSAGVISDIHFGTDRKAGKLKSSEMGESASGWAGGTYSFQPIDREERTFHRWSIEEEHR